MTSTPKNNVNQQIAQALALLRRVTSPSYVQKTRAAQLKDKKKKAHGGKVKKRK